MSFRPRMDIWLLLAAAVVAALYVWMVLLRPGGESWGRGWNMVAFLIYATPVAIVAATIAVWRRSKVQGPLRRAAAWAAAAGFAFPLVCAAVIRLKGWL